MKKLLLLIALLLIFTGFNGSSYVLQDTISTNQNFMTTDNLGNVYSVNNDVLTKYFAAKSPKKTYNNKSLGTITYVDATNAMKPLVFYRDFFQLIFLDNTLSPNGPVVDLLSLNFRQPQAVCSSNNNGLWIFDQLTQELYRLNQQYETVSKSGNLVQIIGHSLSPFFITEYNNMVYMSDKTTGILVFDIFGNYQKTIAINTTKPFQVTEEKIYYQTDSSFHSYNLLSFDKDTITLPEKHYSFVRVQKNTLYIGVENEIKIYEIKQ